MALTAAAPYDDLHGLGGGLDDFGHGGVAVGGFDGHGFDGHGLGGVGLGSGLGVGLGGGLVGGGLGGGLVGGGFAGQPIVSTSVASGRVFHPKITTNLQLVQRSFPVKIPIKVPSIQYVPVPKTFKSVKTVKVPFKVERIVKVPVVKNVKVPFEIPVKTSAPHVSAVHGDVAYSH